MASVKILSINRSEKKGTVKIPVDNAEIDHLGLVGDSHAGQWHRQVSLLGNESYSKVLDASNVNLEHGSFAENITTEGMVLHHSTVFDRFENDEIILEVTQIGKKCHSGCEIQKQIGNCVMPVEGIFCRVLKGGKIKTGDRLEYKAKQVKVRVITLSDRAYSGEYEDRSGPRAEEILAGFFKGNRRQYDINRVIVPDSKPAIEEAMNRCLQEETDIIITTGGTGIGPKDITPEVIRPMLDKEIPGIMEHIRMKYGSEKPNALISRSIAGVAGKTLVYMLPGSVKAVSEYLGEITPTIEHSMRMIYGIDAH